MLLRAHNHDQKGFTMLELMISIAIFAVVIPALTIGVTNVITINNRARDLSLASMVAERKTEELRSAGFNSLAVGTYDISNELPNEISKPRSANYTVTNLTPGIIELTVNISYWDYRQTKTVSYKTIVSELGVGQ